MPEPINQFQRAALEAYAGGAFSYLETYEYRQEHGDSLLTFILAELSDKEDCEDLETALRRIESGISDLQDVLEALQACSS